MNDPSRWFEVVELASGRQVMISKFADRSFSVSVGNVEQQWFDWSTKERNAFADAFSAREELDDNDLLVLDFLIDKGDPDTWNAIALLVSRHPDRSRALAFLLGRVADVTSGVANYYQALGRLRAPECVPALRQTLARHENELLNHPDIETWDDRFAYLDYLACCATLFEITEDFQFREKIERLSLHPNKIVRDMVRMIGESRNISLRR